MDLRVVEIDGEPWFVGADLLRVLYGGAQGKSWAYSPTSPDERAEIDRTTLGLKPGRPLRLISESGLYKLAMRSDKKEAKQFQEWVTRGFSMGKSIYSGCLPKSGIDPHNRTKRLFCWCRPRLALNGSPKGGKRA